MCKYNMPTKTAGSLEIHKKLQLKDIIITIIIAGGGSMLCTAGIASLLSLFQRFYGLNSGFQAFMKHNLAQMYFL